MRRRYILAWAVLVCLFCTWGLQAQQSDSSPSTGTSAPDNTNPPASLQPASGTIPRLIKFNGTVKDLTGKVSTGVVGLTFSLYELPEGGNPLWTETQSLSLDAMGRYTALLGANSPEGLPLDLFTSGKALWVGVQPQLPGQPEQPRMLLVAVPYSLKSSDADTLGGLPASAYMLAPNANTAQGSSVTPLITLPPPCVDGTTASPSAVGLPCPVTPSTPSNAISGGGTANFAAMFTGASTIGNSTIYNSLGGWVGIGTTNPAATLDVHGTGNFAGTLKAAGAVLPATGTATATQGFASNPFDSIASSFNSGTSAAVPQLFRWQAEPATNNTANPSGTLNLLFLSGTGTPAETGLSIASNGQINFASGQTFPGTGTGTVTSVGSGAGLTGGPITTSGALSIATGGVTNTMLANSSLSVLPGTDLLGGGSVPLGGSVTLNLDTTKVPTLAAGSNIFTGSITASSFSGSGSGLTNVNAATLGGSAASAFQPAGSYATLGAGTNTFTGSITAASFTGIGAGLTNLTAANLSAGTAGISITGNAATATAAGSAATATTAGNATNLGGVGAGNYARLDIGNSFTGNQSVTGNVSATGSVSGGTASFTGALSGTSATFSGALTAAGAALPATSVATSSKGYNSNPLDLTASAFNGTNALSPDFRWVAEPANNNSSNASATLNLQFSPNGGTPGETGVSIASNGVITFAPSQTFPGAGGGTITGVTAGTDLTGGGTTGTVTLNLDTTKVPTLAASSNLFTGSITASVFSGNGANVTNVNAASLNGLLSSAFQPAGSYAVTTGANSFGGTQTISSGDLSVSNGNMDLPQTTGSGVGVINLGGSSFIHACCASNGNTFIGQGAGNFGYTSGGLLYNTATGYSALNSNKTGYSNTAVGALSLSQTSGGEYNTAVGQQAGQTNTSGSNNTFVGQNADASTGNLTHATALGSNAIVGASNSLVLGGTGQYAINVGIGDASPAARLTVSGPESTSSGFGSAIKLANTASGGANWYMRAGATGTGTPPGGFSIANDSLYALVIGSNGEVGIGTAAPNAGLEVNGTAKFDGQVTFAGGQTFPGAGTVTSVAAGAGLTGGPITSSGALSIATGGVTNSMILNPSLNVLAGSGLNGGGPVALGGSTTLNLASASCGVGQAVVALPLACQTFATLTQVPQLGTVNTFAQTQNLDTTLNVDFLNANAGAVTPGIVFGNPTGEGISSERAAGGNQYGLDFYTNSTRQMSITNSGSVGIGTNTPYTLVHIRKDVAGALGPSLTLMNGAAGANAGASIDFDGRDPGNTNPPGVRIQSLADGHSSSHLTFLTKVPGADADALVEQVRLTSWGVLNVDSSGSNGGFIDNSLATGTGLVFGLPGSGEGMASNRTTSPNLDGLDFYTDFTNRLAITNTGNVGIGTTTPAATLEVNGTAQFDSTVTFSQGETMTGTETISSGDLALPATTGSTVGVLTIGGASFLHDFGGPSNTFVGASAGNFNGTNSGTNNTAMGQSALAANTSGHANTALGQGALSSNTQGLANTAVGALAGVTGTAGNANTTGFDNTFIGFSAGPGTSTQLSNAAAIGANATVTQSNSLILGGTGTNAVSVGIGQTAPYTTLHVRRDAPGGIGPVITLMNGGAGSGAGGAIYFDGYDPGSANLPAARIFSFDDGNYSAALEFQTKNPGSASNATGTRMIITDVGNIGIGTTSPGALLEVNGTSKFDNTASFLGSANLDGSLNPDAGGTNNGTVNPGITFGTSSGEGIASKRTSGGNQDGLDFYTASTPRMSITNGGFVGIGTQTPTAPLEVFTGDNIGAIIQNSCQGQGALPACSTLVVENDAPSIVATLDAVGSFGSCNFSNSGDLNCTGSKSAVVPVDSGARQVALYAVEAPENWFEDAGSGQLSNGSAVVALEPTFAQTVNTGVEYHVFLTPEGDCEGLYVTHKTATGFEVHELRGGHSNIAFDYRIMARRKGYESIRLADKTKFMESVRRNRPVAAREAGSDSPAVPAPSADANVQQPRASSPTAKVQW